MQDKKAKEYASHIYDFQRASLHNRLSALSTKRARLTPANAHKADSLNARFKPACEYDGLIGSFILTTIAMPAFAGALEQTLGETSANIYNALTSSCAQTIAGEYIKDKDTRHKPKIHGSGTYAVTGDQKSLRMIFKDSGFDRLHHERRQIENTMHALTREYDSFALRAA